MMVNMSDEYEEGKEASRTCQRKGRKYRSQGKASLWKGSKHPSFIRRRKYGVICNSLGRVKVKYPFAWNPYHWFFFLLPYILVTGSKYIF